jgi:hypothetical protein
MLQQDPDNRQTPQNQVFAQPDNQEIANVAGFFQKPSILSLNTL